MNNLAWWGLVFVLCLLIELSSPGYFFFLSFSFGAIAALGASWISGNFGLGLGVFLAVSAFSFLVLRRYTVSSQEDGVKTNVYALKGRKGVVLAKITPYERGWIKVDGETWAALPTDESSIEEGAYIEVVSSAGSHLKVKEIQINS